MLDEARREKDILRANCVNRKLTEVNVTSPTGIQQMSRFAGRSCETPVIEWLEAKTA